MGANFVIANFTSRVLVLGIIPASLRIMVVDNATKSGKPSESLVAVTTTDKKTIVGELSEQNEQAKSVVIQDVVEGKRVHLGSARTHRHAQPCRASVIETWNQLSMLTVTR
jgi:hypothetical protein